jgi:hypothetical protein
VLARTAIAAAAGGTASVLTGGKFANGAITGAMAHLFNAEGGGRTFARDLGAVLGGVAGGTVAAAATGVCASATAGSCAIAAPEVVGGGIALGAATGSVMASSIYDSLSETYANDNQASVHGNSALNMDGTELYYLRDLGSNEIVKIGVTSYSTQRYTSAQLAGMNAQYQSQAFYQSRYAAYLDEFIRLQGYRTATGQYPKYNINGR